MTPVYADWKPLSPGCFSHFPVRISQDQNARLKAGQQISSKG